MTARTGSSAQEVELWRLLQHARSCDGLRRSEAGKLVACSTCSLIDRRLEDGPAYFADDPQQRMEAVDKALVTIARQQMRLATSIEASSLPQSARAVALQLVEWVERTRTLLTLPIMEIPGYDDGRERPVRERPRRAGPRERAPETPTSVIPRRPRPPRTAVVIAIVGPPKRQGLKPTR